MSETELRVGKAKKIPVPDGLDGPGKIKWLYQNGFIPKDEVDFSIDLDFEYEYSSLNTGDLEYFYYNDEICYLNGTFWSVEAEKCDTGGYINATPTENEDEYNFTCLWYNGSAGFGEILEIALNRAGALPKK